MVDSNSNAAGMPYADEHQIQFLFEEHTEVYTTVHRGSTTEENWIWGRQSFQCSQLCWLAGKDGA